ncbi:peptidase family M50 [archaeon BMS3Bbin16]|nr:peptidase family M50 [archaeon BMS3Bbin16]
MRFSETEIKHIGIALFVITLALTLFFFGSFSVDGFIIMLLTFGVAFISHELAHKFVAQRYGYWAEFRYWNTGLILGILMGITQKFLFLAPGAVYISSGAYGMPKRQNAYISLAGAATNVALAFIFLLLAPLFGSTISGFAVSINLLLALFNMLPIPPLDGSKVFAWDKQKWAIIFVGLIVLRSILG